MRNIILLTTLLFVGIINVLAQTNDGKVHKEDDGFEWIETSGGTASAVAQHMDGRVIIDSKLKCDWVSYAIAEDGVFSIGYFKLTQFKDGKMREAICDLEGNVIIPFKHHNVGMSVKLCDTDTLAYIYTCDEKLKIWNIYDIKGRGIASNIKTFGKDDYGNFIDWDSKKNLGIRMPNANGQLSNFYLKQSGKNIQTSLGMYEVQEKENDGFKWNLLYKGSLCGAQTVDGRTIVPVEKKCDEIEYENGVFIAKTIDNVYCVYSKDGKEIVSTSYDYYHISVDVFTKTFLSCAQRNNNDNKASLHDLNGDLIFPTGIYSNISPRKVNNRLFFIVSKDGKSQVLDYDKKLLVSIDYPCHVSDIYEDRLGIYYKILHSDIERNSGIVDDKGNVVIAPGRYDLIKRVVNDKVAFYETTIIKGGNPSQEFLNGVCDLEGYEVLPNEYSYCPYSTTEIFEMDKGSMRYKINIAQLIANAKTQRNNQLTSAQYTQNRGPENQDQVSPSYLQSNNMSSSSSNSRNSNSEYTALNDPNLVDNSEKISRCEKVIEELENQKLHCSYCNGTHKISTICTVCKGTGITKMGYYTPQVFKCSYCGGTGHTYKPCIECQNTDVAISISRNMLKTYQETHGMTKETAAFYYEHNSRMAQMERDYQNTINAIAEPYLNGTRKSNSSDSSANSPSKCSICNGTGVDPFPYEGTGGAVGSGLTGAYTNSSGSKCPYCEKYTWHQHVYCPKCRTDKHP